MSRRFSVIIIERIANTVKPATTTTRESMIAMSTRSFSIAPSRTSGTPPRS
jgi:hypothetical protein